MSFGSAPEFNINKTHKIKLFVLHKTFLKAVKQRGIMIFPNFLYHKRYKKQKVKYTSFHQDISTT